MIVCRFLTLGSPNHHDLCSSCSVFYDMSFDSFSMLYLEHVTEHWSEWNYMKMLHTLN